MFRLETLRNVIEILHDCSWNENIKKYRQRVLNRDISRNVIENVIDFKVLRYCRM